jgi:hypothetical protein
MRRISMSPAAKAKAARSPRTGRAKAKDPEPAAEAPTNGEVTEDEAKESAREAAKREKEEKAAEERAAAIESGDLIVTKDFEFVASDKVTASAETMRKILNAYQESEEPLIFNEVATKAGAKYPEDLVIAMYALEDFDLVRKFTARATGSDAGRSRVAFLWTGEEVEE